MESGQDAAHFPLALEKLSSGIPQEQKCHNGVDGMVRAKTKLSAWLCYDNNIAGPTWALRGTEQLSPTGRLGVTTGVS